MTKDYLAEFDEWVKVTGALPEGTSVYWECRSFLEEAQAYIDHLEERANGQPIDNEPLRETEVYYDKRGQQIHEFDLLKVFHFQSRRKKHYMYKWVRRKQGHLFALHLCDEPEKGYWLKGGGHKNGHFSEIEIIQSPYLLEQELQRAGFKTRAERMKTNAAPRT